MIEVKLNISRAIVYYVHESPGALLSVGEYNLLVVSQLVGEFSAIAVL